MMTTHDVQTLLTIGENIVIEFKRAGDGPKWDTYESICAFLNRNGGDLLLGVADDGKIVGLPPKGVDDMVKSIVKVMNDPNLWEPRIALFPEVLTVSGVRNLYHYVRIYSGADPVFDEGDIFRLTVPLDDDYSPEKGHLSKRGATLQTTQEIEPHKSNGNHISQPHKLGRNEVATQKTGEGTTQKAELGTTQKTDLSATQKISEGKLSVTAKQIMAMMKVEPKVTTVELARRLGLSRDGINYHIRVLKNKKLLRRNGPDKGGVWEPQI